VANIIVTILTFILICFGIYNLCYYYKGLAEYKSTIGFYIFSLAALLLSLANGWIYISEWDEISWQLTSLSAHWTSTCMALCQGVCFVILSLTLTNMKKDFQLGLCFQDIQIELKRISNRFLLFSLGGATLLYLISFIFVVYKKTKGEALLVTWLELSWVCIETLVSMMLLAVGAWTVYQLK